MKLKLIDAEIFEFDNYYEWDSHFESFSIDAGHEIIDSKWYSSRKWGYIIVKLG